ncbi:MAG: hypothetical protein E2P02_30325 [Acidobacteria bacterium]|nr:MAG: hypothetical protein E2P02_30325 [Acidobacteriota bacterium]
MPTKDAVEGFSFAAIPACLSAWLVPGLGHFMIGKRHRGIIFFAVVVALFTLGIRLEGELFELDTGELLTLLAGLAEMGVGLPYFIIKMMKLGGGTVTAVTYEYGYTFCIVAGLLNMLIVLDVYDILVGRKD